MIELRNSPPTPISTAQADEASAATAPAPKVTKRPPPDEPLGMPPSKKQKKADTDAKRKVEWASFGISDRNEGIKKVDGGKGKALEAHAVTALTDPSTSPVGAIGAAMPDNLIKKVAAPKAGDHSPSISAVKNTESGQASILGRGAKSIRGAFNVKQTNVPTLQFTTTDFKSDDGSHAKVRDSAAHSVFTSLREMHGAGEQSGHADMDSLLDSTARAYSPYNAHGERAPANVELPRTNVHAEIKKGPTLHKSSNGVDPLVGQQMMNIWYRQSMARQPMLGDRIKARQEEEDEEDV